MYSVSSLRLELGCGATVRADGNESAVADMLRLGLLIGGFDKKAAAEV